MRHVSLHLLPGYSLHIGSCFFLTLILLIFSVWDFLPCVLIRSHPCMFAKIIRTSWIWLHGLRESSIPECRSSIALVTHKHHIYLSFITFWKCYRFSYCPGNINFLTRLIMFCNTPPQWTAVFSFTNKREDNSIGSPVVSGEHKQHRL